MKTIVMKKSEVLRMLFENKIDEDDAKEMLSAVRLNDALKSCINAIDKKTASVKAN